MRNAPLHAGEVLGPLLQSAPGVFLPISRYLFRGLGSPGRASSRQFATPLASLRLSLFLLPTWISAALGKTRIYATHNCLTILPQLHQLILLLFVLPLQHGEFTVLLFDLGLELPEFNQNIVSTMVVEGEIHTASVR